MEKDGPSSRMLHIQEIPDTKSVFVVATAPCSCSADPVFPHGLTKGKHEQHFTLIHSFTFLSLFS